MRGLLPFAARGIGHFAKVLAKFFRGHRSIHLVAEKYRVTHYADGRMDFVVDGFHQQARMGPCGGIGGPQ
ncbi:hypothetical protein D3C83_180990 [compost metagenome]